jgi:AcrR family transcriptional regulator
MNKALIELLEKKEFEYITIKEICSQAGVNRSTFYLHYENTTDLLNETTQYITDNFLSYFSTGEKNFSFDYLTFESNTLGVCFPAGSLMGHPSGSYMLGIRYEDISHILHPWAIPDSIE